MLNATSATKRAILLTNARKREMHGMIMDPMQGMGIVKKKLAHIVVHKAMSSQNVEQNKGVRDLKPAWQLRMQ